MAVVNPYNYRTDYNLTNRPDKNNRRYWGITGGGAGDWIGGNPYVFGMYDANTTNTANQAANYMSNFYGVSKDAPTANDKRTTSSGGGSGGYGMYASPQLLALQDYYNRMQQFRDSIYAEGLRHLREGYDMSKGQLKAQNEIAQRGNYVTDMVNQKNFGQIASAQGLTGGASESAAAGLANNYAKLRNDTDMATNTELGKLLQQLKDNEYDLWLRDQEGRMEDYANYQENLMNLLGSSGYGYGSGYDNSGYNVSNATDIVRAYLNAGYGSNTDTVVARLLNLGYNASEIGAALKANGISTK